MQRNVLQDFKIKNLSNFLKYLQFFYFFDLFPATEALEPAPKFDNKVLHSF